MDLDHLQRFVAVAEAASFSGAARRLGIPKSRLSRSVATLEADLGTRLLHRTTRQVSLSTSGAALYERAAPLLGALRQAIGALPEQQEEPSGELRITAPNDLGAAVLAELGVRFTTRFPKVRIDARLTNLNVDLVGEGFDLALRTSAGRLRDSSLVARRLSALELDLYASPEYLARRGTPRTLQDAAAHDWVLFRGRVPSGLSRDVGGRIRADDFFYVRESLRAGAGLGMLPRFLAQPLIDSGQLTRILPRYSEQAGTLFFVYPQARHVPRKVTAFRDFLVEALQRRPLSGPPGSRP